jgi:hypothetical protein
MNWHFFRKQDYNIGIFWTFGTKLLSRGNKTNIYKNLTTFWITHGHVTYSNNKKLKSHGITYIFFMENIVSRRCRARWTSWNKTYWDMHRSSVRVWADDHLTHALTTWKKAFGDMHGILVRMCTHDQLTQEKTRTPHVLRRVQTPQFACIVKRSYPDCDHSLLPNNSPAQNFFPGHHPSHYGSDNGTHTF